MFTEKITHTMGMYNEHCIYKIKIILRLGVQKRKAYIV